MALKKMTILFMYYFFLIFSSNSSEVKISKQFLNEFKSELTFRIGIGVHFHYPISRLILRTKLTISAIPKYVYGFLTNRTCEASCKTYTHFGKSFPMECSWLHFHFDCFVNKRI